MIYVVWTFFHIFMIEIIVKKKWCIETYFSHHPFTSKLFGKVSHSFKAFWDTTTKYTCRTFDLLPIFWVYLFYTVEIQARGEKEGKVKINKIESWIYDFAGWNYIRNLQSPGAHSSMHINTITQKIWFYKKELEAQKSLRHYFWETKIQKNDEGKTQTLLLGGMKCRPQQTKKRDDDGLRFLAGVYLFHVGRDTGTCSRCPFPIFH